MTTFCRATLNYAPRDPAAERRGLSEVEVRDARAARLPGWDECGFELVNHAPAVTDWTDDNEIAAVHYPEVEELARKLTGCDYALVADHVKRTAEQSKREREQSPVRLVHSDFAPGYDEIVKRNYRNVRGRGAATLARSGLTADDIAKAER